MRMKRLTGILVDGLKELGIISNPTEPRKNHGVVRQGLTLRRGDERVCPIFYLDCFYEKYKSGELSAEDILQQIIVEYEKTPTPTVPDLDELMSSPDFISKIKLTDWIFSADIIKRKGETNIEIKWVTVGEERETTIKYIKEHIVHEMVYKIQNIIGGILSVKGSSN